MLKIKGKYTDALITIDDIEEACLQQVYAMTNHVAFDGKIVMMPDCHAGKSAPVGFSMPLGEKVLPNSISVDIGCGVLSANVGNQVSLNKDKLLKIDEYIRDVVPMGNKIHQRSSIPSKYFEKNFKFDEATESARNFIMKYNKKFNTNFDYVRYSYDWFLKKQKEIGMKQDAELAVGTLGGGNHYWEVGVSENTGDIWITVHSGSRNFGKMICEYHQNNAKSILDNKRKVVLTDKIREIKEQFPGRDIPNEIKKAKQDLGLDFDFNINGMEFLEGQDAINYFMDMIFAQKYADFNRTRMIELVVNKLNIKILDTIHSIHNFINFEDMIIRKGAISSYIGERMVIPLNMADGMLICEGKSNPDWNNSACHGAGRIMSRGEASRKVDLKDFQFRMKDVVSTSVCKATLDESPQSYKKSAFIEAAIAPTAKILDRVKPILNLKDKGESMTWKEKRLKAKSEKDETKNRKQMRKMRGK